MENQNSSKEKPKNPVGWFEIYVDDINRARKFYESVFEIKMEDLPVPGDEGIEMVAFPMNMDGPNASGAIVQMSYIKPGGNSTIVYFTSEYCAIEEARVEKAGGKIQTPKMSIGDYGFVSLCTDTEGNMIGIHSMQ